MSNDYDIAFAAYVEADALSAAAIEAYSLAPSAAAHAKAIAAEANARHAQAVCRAAYAALKSNN